MSTGDRHPHKHASAEHVLADPGVHEYLKRPFHLDLDHDILDAAGYSIGGRRRYVDRSLIAAIRRGEFVVDGKKIDVDTFLGPTLTHEGVENARLDTSLDIYEGSHEDWAVPAEDEVIRHLGFDPKVWNDALAPLIKKYCEPSWGRPDFNPPRDLDCSPILDDPDANDLKAITALRRAGVDDAFKLPRHAVGYAAGKPQGDHCAVCANYLGGPEGGPCKVVNGFVQPAAWCRRFEAKQEDADMPARSQAQNAAMHAAAAGKSTLGIPQAVGREFTAGQTATSMLPQHIADAKKVALKNEPRHHALRKASATHLHAAGDITTPHHDRIHADAERQLTMIREGKVSATPKTYGSLAP